MNKKTFILAASLSLAAATAQAAGPNTYPGQFIPLVEAAAPVQGAYYERAEGRVWACAQGGEPTRWACADPESAEKYYVQWSPTEGAVTYELSLRQGRWTGQSMEFGPPILLTTEDSTRTVLLLPRQALPYLHIRARLNTGYTDWAPVKGCYWFYGQKRCY